MQKQEVQPGAVPNFPGVGSGSDFAPFLQQIGTSIINIGWSPHPSVGGYPVYHSVYETFELVDELLDPGFHIHRETAMMCALCKSILHKKCYAARKFCTKFGHRNNFCERRAYNFKS